MKITCGHNFPILQITPFRFIYVLIISAIAGVAISPWAIIPVVLASLYLD